jgi:hypothetical protein
MGYLFAADVIDKLLLAFAKPPKTPTNLKNLWVF